LGGDGKQQRTAVRKMTLEMSEEDDNDKMRKLLLNFSCQHLRNLAPLLVMTYWMNITNSEVRKNR